jgi:carbamoyl-phosphate synthase small subunit
MIKGGHLVLADGSVFSGNEYLGPLEPAVGEAVFSTSNTGYTEILSDPSFYNQIVILAQPEVGNYGVNSADFQSEGIKAKALIVRSLYDGDCYWRSHMSLREWLRKENIAVLAGVDTRALILHLRDHGVMMAALSSIDTASHSLLDKATNAPTMSGMRLSPFVSTTTTKPFGIKSSRPYHVVIMDFGVKRSIIHMLEQKNCAISLIRGSASYEEIMALKPDGICLSNGPGDPRTEYEAVHTTKRLIGQKPLLGICLGHQIIAQALGFSIYKMPFGHRGSNAAVQLSDGRIVITAQNHGFAVLADLENKAFNLADHSNEAFTLPHLAILSQQFHPEGAPGPYDSADCFDEFLTYMSSWKDRNYQEEIRI